MIDPKYLPIGTVVMLNGGKKRAMIIGFCPIAEENKMYDYSGCLYPEGVLSSDQTLLFNHDQISQVYFKGYVDDEQGQFIAKLNHIVENLGNIVPTPQVGTPAPQPAAQPAPAPTVGITPPAGIAPVGPQAVQAPVEEMKPISPMPVAPAPIEQPTMQPIGPAPVENIPLTAAPVVPPMPTDGNPQA